MFLPNKIVTTIRFCFLSLFNEFILFEQKTSIFGIVLPHYMLLQSCNSLIKKKVVQNDILKYGVSILELLEYFNLESLFELKLINCCIIVDDFSSIQSKHKRCAVFFIVLRFCGISLSKKNLKKANKLITKSKAIFVTKI